MFHRLRHDAVVGGDDEQRVLVAGDARDHVVNETAVARHVDEADAGAADVGIRETEIDGQAPAPFLGETVGVDAGQCPHHGRLAVIDVTRERDDHVDRVVREAISSSNGSAHRMSSQRRPDCRREITGMGRWRSLAESFSRVLPGPVMATARLGTC